MRDDRLRKHVAVETDVLRAAARRARLFDHKGNRGSDAEDAFRRWMRELLAPDYVVSSGEIIGSFGAESPSRQLDAIVHRNEPDANAFLLPSGLRLVPVECVASVVEVKLKLGKKEFDAADAAARATTELRWRVDGGSFVNGAVSQMLATEDREKGIPLHDARMRSQMVPTFAVFGFTGAKRIMDLVAWIKAAKAVSVVCCLDAGFAARVPMGVVVSPPDTALSHFASRIRLVNQFHHDLRSWLRVSFREYASLTDLALVWDETGSVTPPTTYVPEPGEPERIERIQAVIDKQEKRAGRRKATV